MSNSKASAYKNPYTAHKKSEKGTSWLYGLLVAFTGLFFILSPYNRGLFLTSRMDFNPQYSLGFFYPVYIAELFTFAALLLLAIFAFREWKPEGWKAYGLLYVWVIPLLYLIAVFNAASPYMALQGFYVQLLYAAFFVFGAAVSERKQGVLWVTQSILTAGYIIVIYGFVYWLGNMPNGTKGILVENRLTSIFTYANSYAAYLIALVFAGAFCSIILSKGFGRFYHALFLVPATLSLLLTLSRGGLVLVPVILLCVLPFLRLAKQAALLVNLAVSTIIALAISSYITDTGLSLQKTFVLSSNVKAWALLAGASVVAALIGWVFHRFAEPGIEKRTTGWRPVYNRLAMTGAAVVLLALGLLLIQIPAMLHLLPQTLQHRIETINLEQHSVLERGYFYKDAMKIVADYPVLGTGSGGWATLYQAYQSYPYSSRQAHNYIMQTWVDIGTVGLAALILLILWVAINYIRSWIKYEKQEGLHLVYLIIAGSILAHSTIDFDMSYVYLSALVFLCLGGMLSATQFKGKEKAQSKAARRSPSTWVLPALTLIVSCVMLIFSIQMLSSNVAISRVTKAISTGQTVNFNDIMPPVEKAIQQNPYNADYTLLKVSILNNVYQQTKDQQWLTAASQTLSGLEQREQHLRDTYDYRYQWAADKPAEAVVYLRDQLKLAPWDINLYDQIIQADINLGTAAAQDEALQLYNNVQERIKIIGTIPKSITISIPFAVTPTMASNIGQLQYTRKDYKAAAATLKGALTDNLDLSQPQNVIMVRYYLAALKKQGMNDQAWMDKLLAKDPSQKALIDQLAAS